MRIKRALWGHSLFIRIRLWVLLTTLALGMVSCTDDGINEVSVRISDQSIKVGNISHNEAPEWFASMRDGTHVSLGDVLPWGTPALLYFFSPG